MNYAWGQEEFEDEVAAALVAMYESNIVANRGAGPLKLKPKDLTRIRRSGAYIPGNDRVIWAPEPGAHVIDLTNDGMPTSGCFGFSGHPLAASISEGFRGYFTAFAFRRLAELPRRCVRPGPGALFEITVFSAETKGVTGERRYVVVTSDGRVEPCDQMVQSRASRGRAMPVYQSAVEPHVLAESAAWGGVAMQYAADARFCWSIQAEEARAKVTIGCQIEEIKSLLYARSLPVTATGRKRPVLHLVESHRRRLKSGIDVNVTSFLRGVQQIEMGGTLFTVKPPAVSKTELSNGSARYFN